MLFTKDFAISLIIHGFSHLCEYNRQRSHTEKLNTTRVKAQYLNLRNSYPDIMLHIYNFTARKPQNGANKSKRHYSKHPSHLHLLAVMATLKPV